MPGHRRLRCGGLLVAGAILFTVLPATTALSAGEAHGWIIVGAGVVLLVAGGALLRSGTSAQRAFLLELGDSPPQSLSSE